MELPVNIVVMLVILLVFLAVMLILLSLRLVQSYNRPIIVYTHRTARTRDDDKCSKGLGFDAGLHCLCMSGWCRRRQ
jgi:regulator of protease activity HflC (stomatin/prohibitin superfamily)